MAISAPGRWRRRLLTVAAGLLWLAVLAAARAWWAGSPAPDAPKLPPHLGLVLHVLMAPALAAVCWAYLRLWFEPPPAEARRQVLAWSLGLAAVAALALPLTSNDVFSYLAYGRMMHLGLDPGRWGPAVLPLGDPFRALVSHDWVESPSVYGPVSLAIFWLSTVSGAVWPSLLLYKLLSLVTAWLVIVTAYRTCEATLPEARIPAALVMTIANPLLLWEVAGQGHNDGLMVAFAFVAVALVYRRRGTWSAFSLFVGMLVKSAVAPALFFVAAWRLPRLRGRYYAAACLAGAALAGLALQVTPGLLLTINAPLREADVATRLFNSVPALLYYAAGLAGPAAALGAYRIYWTLSVAGVAAFVIHAGRRTETPQDVVEHSLRALLLIVIVFSPNVQPWYFLWMLPFAAHSESEALRGLVVFASAGVLLLYAAPLALPTWLLASGLWLSLLTVMSLEPGVAPAAVRALTRSRRATEAPRAQA